MKFYEIIDNLGITAGEYYDGCYNMEKNQCGFDQPAAVFKKTNGAQAFVVASDTYENIADTIFMFASEEGKKLFPILQKTNFFFVMLLPSSGNIEELEIPDEVFVDLAEAKEYAKHQLSSLK